MTNSETMRFRNTSDRTLKLGSIGLPDIAPAGEIEIPLTLCAPSLRDNGGRGQSPIERAAPQLVPVNPAELIAWQSTPSPLPEKSLKASVAPRPADEPAGVVALRAAQQAIKNGKVNTTETVTTVKPGDGSAEITTTTVPATATTPTTTITQIKGGK